MELEHLIKLVNAVSASKLTGFKYEEGGVKLHMAKKETSLTREKCAPKESVPDIQKEETAFKIIKSPLVGTFYKAPSEDAEAFAAVGDTVKKGQTLAIIEAMKLMNEIESEYDGIIEEVLAENGQTVEYGQPLFKIR